jgi:hypothetical protein
VSRVAAAPPSPAGVRRSRVEVTPKAVAGLVAPAPAGQLPTHRDLLLQALLHLPRIAAADGTVDADAARREIARLRAERDAELAPLVDLASPPSAPARLDELEVRAVAHSVGDPILEHFHYLRSPRRDALHVAAIHRGRIAALCSFSPLDLPAIAAALPIADAAEAMVVSRAFAFDWAPRNVTSFMLARAERMAGVRDHKRALVTYVNPNMGFSGASFKAANWLPLGVERGTRYAYLDGRYVTDRERDLLVPSERRRVVYSRMPLRPLQLLCRLLDRRLARAYPGGMHTVLERP